MTHVFIVYLVGNIPYGVTEEQLKDIFSEAGPVISFRLILFPNSFIMHVILPVLTVYLLSCYRIVQDRETGRSKGFGFCEFQDHGSAENAMRNLNGYEINGRTLRVDSANRKN